MLCEEFEVRLNAVLDERGRPQCDARLREHADACPECRNLAAGYDALLDGFCSLAAPTAPRDMAARVLAELPVRPALAPRRVLAGAVLATAAAVLVALLPPGSVATREDVLRAQRAPVNPALVASNVPLDALPLLQSVPGINGETELDLYTALARQTGSGLASIVLYVPGVGGTRGIIDVESSTPKVEATWAARVSEGLRPVTDSVTDTLNLLWNVLPVADRARRS